MSTTPKAPTAGFVFTDCENVTMRDNHVSGFDHAVIATRTRGLTSEGMTATAPGVSVALARRDPRALLASLGIPHEMPLDAVREALDAVAKAPPNEVDAIKVVRTSRLAPLLGHGANIATITQALLSLACSTQFHEAMRVLSQT